MTNNSATVTAETISAYKEQLLLEPENIDILSSLAQYYLDSHSFSKAENYLQKIATLAPENSEIKFYLGQICYEQAKYNQAIAWLNESLELNPYQQQALNNLGLCYIRKQDFDTAIANFNKCLDLDDSSEHAAIAYNQLATICIEQKQFAMAIELLGQAISINSSDITPKYNLCSCLIAQGNFAKAERLLTDLHNDKHLPEIHIIQQSRILKRQGKMLPAIKLLQEYCLKQPDATMVLVELADIHLQMEELSKAETLYSQALSNTNDKIPILLNLSKLAMQSQNFAAARDYLGQILNINPSHVSSYLLMASCCMQEANLEGTINCAEIAISLEPSNHIGYTLAADGLIFRYINNPEQNEQDKEQALVYYLKALELSPEDPEIAAKIASATRYSTNPELEFKLLENSLVNLFTAYDKLNNKEADPLYFTKAEALALSYYATSCRKQGLWQQEAKVIPILKKVTTDQLIDNLPITLPIFNAQYLIPKPSWQLKLASAYANNHNVGKSCAYKRHNSLTKDKLRIGYISPDFNNHVIGFLLQDLFKYHDRDKVIVSAYYLRDIVDTTTNVISASVDQFNFIAELSHKDAAAKIYQDKVDILVDLAGYTTGCRPEILSYKPAPIQLHFLGQAGTMGADFIPYHLGTPSLIPEAQLELYSERIAYLPDTPIAVKPFNIPDKMPTRAEYGLPDDALVFCCFNNPYRIDNNVFNCWLNILAEVPNSVLWLDTMLPQYCRNLQDYAKQQGIAPDRLVFRPHCHLTNDWHHRLADIYLDTWVISGGTTGILAAAAGLPVISMAGNTPQARFGSAILAACNMPELIVNSIKEYFSLAVELSNNKVKRLDLVKKLTTNWQISTLCQQQKFCSQLEDVYYNLAEDLVNSGTSKVITYPYT